MSQDREHQVDERSRKLGLEPLKGPGRVAAVQRLLDIQEGLSSRGGNGWAGPQERLVVVFFWKVLLLDRKSGALERLVCLGLQLCGF